MNDSTLTESPVGEDVGVALGDDPIKEPLVLLKAILHWLSKSDCHYALIHHGTSLNAAVTSDVDIAFDRNPNGVLLPILNRLSEAGHVQIIQCLHYEIPHGYYYILRLAGSPPRFLHLDCLYDPLGINRYHLPTSFLLRDTVTDPWPRTGREREAVYLLIKRAIKGKASQEGLENLRSCFSQATDSLWRDVEAWFGSKSRKQVEQLLQSQNLQQAGAQLAGLRICLEQRFRRRHPLRYSLSLVKDGIRKLQRFIKPTGLFVVILGPDGSGKSTVAGLVLSQLERAFRKTWRFHWRPGLLPKLGCGRAVTDKQKNTDSAPAEVSKYKGVVSLVRFFYYWLDFILGYWLIIYPRRAQTTLVLGERYFPDVLVHPERYGFAVPRWLMRLAAMCVPSPDLLILLEDDPKIIYARKPELPVARIAAQIAAYKQEIKHWSNTAVITTTGGADDVAQRIDEIILNACSRRTARRVMHDQWYGFPSAARAKVWVNDQDSLANALNLYHPYSRLGRLAKFVIRLLPEAMIRAFLGRPSDASEAHRLGRLAETIRRVLCDKALAVSFSTGTPGPHRKLTAQVSRAGEVIAYVKIGHGRDVSALLEQEEKTLRWLEGANFTGAIAPRVLASAVCDGDHLLFLTSPEHPGRQRRMELDEKDTKFLSALSRKTRTMPVDEVFGQMGLPGSLEHLQSADSTATAIVRHAMESVRTFFNNRGVEVAPCHGDYAPWNTLDLNERDLYVFDWEYARNDAPLLTDLFHRVFMPSWLVLRKTPRETVNRLLGLYDDPVLGPVVQQPGISRTEMPAYLLLYLLGQLMRESARAGLPDKFLMESIGRALMFSGHPLYRRKVLVVAYACEPGGGSEPGVGWNMCQAISRENEAWVITRKNNRESIEAALAANPNPHLHFAYADLPKWARFWKKGGRFTRVYYYLWQFAALREAIKLKRKVDFDLAHHVTFVCDWMFSFLALLPVPFIWGPLGSNQRMPAPLVHRKWILFGDRIRYYFQLFMRTADPLYWLCAIRARLVIGIGEHIIKRFPLSILAADKFICHTAIGVEQLYTNHVRNNLSNREFRVLGMGRLIPLKGFHKTVMAFATFSANFPESRLTIVGSGFRRSYIEHLVTDLGISGKVEFIDWLPRNEALAEMGKADVFLFPSYEGSGMVVLEAMAHGLPVICMDFGGPGKMVTRECGYAVESRSLNEVVQELAEALKTLACDRELRMKMGAAARQHVKENYLWQNRHEAIRQWYFAAMVGVPRGSWVESGRKTRNEVG